MSNATTKRSICSAFINVYLLEEGKAPREELGHRSLARGGMSYDEYSRRSMVDTSEEISERLQPMAKAGTGYFIIYLLRVAYDPALVEHLAREVILNFA
jgi:hypothetical protein